MGRGLKRRGELMAELTPAWKILDILPEECQSCVKILPKVDELSFWVNDGRMTALRASRLILELAGCENPLSVKAPVA